MDEREQLRLDLSLQAGIEKPQFPELSTPLRYDQVLSLAQRETDFWSAMGVACGLEVSQSDVQKWAHDELVKLFANSLRRTYPYPQNPPV
ncbi:hypothetical protein A3F00_04105 [Candidatus Daviesbacteria bacterium RIFCSPHIGHO2_12_FULL_37_11]|uniref:Uncharacterized protein n=1 Tax=Candidatus Daviesbacteria bacterium RIFCSPHIGHO2_12_FULL_37_11 TaxID=1797777 RepID=A0A1F5KE66_9BACT|nr:MAG: hypothetical protein A2769_02790 [Candidatus Daviesbacteria bacterium RIFCSPHIGHO2_01_FULL_37_27]OGE39242.1 MAG: hypothetical protein A3F00_04105 [Candidatus Daviesbacteria bacterium RIFCSPHIGHO2_12_FULL_37_11]OGE45640.1 MAG: hypothetical protein A3B39_00615 [Candidatus Daviesbacteria bacterium RIFCSPLOWO2_01_FULL_37_10]